MKRDNKLENTRSKLNISSVKLDLHEQEEHLKYLAFKNINISLDLAWDVIGKMFQIYEFDTSEEFVETIEELELHFIEAKESLSCLNPLDGASVKYDNFKDHLTDYFKGNKNN